MELLAAAGIEAVLVRTGREALEELQQDSARYDIVLMDIQMPEMDGYEAARRIRADGRFPDLPIIALTAHALVEEKQKALDAGMNDHISKPIDPQAMFETIGRHCRRTLQAVQTRLAEIESPAISIPVIEGVDVDSGLGRVAGNRKLYRDLLHRYLDSQRGAEKGIREALERRDTDLAEQIAHGLKGVSGNIGAVEVAAAAADIEQAVRNGISYGDMRESLERLSRVLAKTMAGIESADAKAPEPETDAAAGDAGAVTFVDIFGELRRSAEASESRAVKYLESVRSRLAARVSRDEIGNLHAALKSYDFTEALKILERLRGLLP